jgi:uncharacterized protein (DUF2384 family)
MATAEALIDVARKAMAMAGRAWTGQEFPPTEHGPLPENHNRDAVVDRAIEVIGDKQEALRWLGTPVRALGYATPISRLNDPEGEADVLAVLDKLEHGVL